MPLRLTCASKHVHGIALPFGVDEFVVQQAVLNIANSQPVALAKSSVATRPRTSADTFWLKPASKPACFQHHHGNRNNSRCDLGSVMCCGVRRTPFPCKMYIRCWKRPNRWDTLARVQHLMLSWDVWCSRDDSGYEDCDVVSGYVLVVFGPDALVDDEDPQRTLARRVWATIQNDVLLKLGLFDHTHKCGL